MIKTGKENKTKGKFVQSEMHFDGKQTKKVSNIPLLLISKELLKENLRLMLLRSL
jgi:hypothetical protein